MDLKFTDEERLELAEFYLRQIQGRVAPYSRVSLLPDDWPEIRADVMAHARRIDILLASPAVPKRSTRAKGGSKSTKGRLAKKKEKP